MSPTNEGSLVSNSDIEKGDSVSNNLPSTDDTSPQHPAGSKAEPEETNPTILPSITDWNGDKDPDNPQNWSLSLRIYHVVIPGLFGFVV